MPKTAIAPIKNNAGLKSPFLTRKPITNGTETEDKFPMKLNPPPVNPMRFFGASNETNTHVIDAMPFPKNAIAINKMISAGLLT